MNRLPFRLVATFCLALLSCNRVVADPARIGKTITQLFGPSVDSVTTSWVGLIGQQGSANATEITRHLGAVNDFFNTRIQQEEDSQIWGTDDYWATLGELFSKGAGDSEDFVIAKYLSLREIGVPDRQLRLIFVKKAFRGTPSRPHIVLGYYPTQGGPPLILDNIDRAVKPASERNDLTPVSSFNAEGMWLGADVSAKSPGTGLSKWQALLERARREGFN